MFLISFRYHRTEGDVIVSDDPSEIERHYVGPESSWIPAYQHGDYNRPARHPYERWDGPEYTIQRMPIGEDYRNVRFAAESHPHSYMPPSHQRQQGPLPRELSQPVYRGQYSEHDRQFMPHHPGQLPPDHNVALRQQQIQTEQPSQLYKEQERTSQWPIHSDELQQTSSTQDDLEDDSRTVIMAPAASRLNQLQSQEEMSTDKQQSDHLTQLDHEQHSSAFNNSEAQESQTEKPGTEASQQEIEQNEDEEHEHYSEEQFNAGQSLHVRSQPLSTEDSGALSGKDKLGPVDTDVFDSRETHEESDRLGPRTTDASRNEDRNHHSDGEEEDSDSGIGKDGTGLRLKKSNLMEKKSLFTIAYDGMQTRGLKSAGDRDDSP